MKLTAEEQDLLAENRELLPLVHKLLSSFLNRHIEKILTQTIDGNSGTELLLARARLDGMKLLLTELQHAIKNR